MARFVLPGAALVPCVALVADPPWHFGDSLPGDNRGASKNYDTLDLQGIKDFRLPVLADNAWLFMWRVSSMVEEAYEVCRAWGFTPKTELVWLKRTVNGKRHFGMGRYLRGEHETCLVATRGSIFENTVVAIFEEHISCIVATRGRVHPLVRNVRTTFEAPAGEHSEKPEEFYQIVESLTRGPYVELFARKERPGWVCFGNEITNAAPAERIL